MNYDMYSVENNFIKTPKKKKYDDEFVPNKSKKQKKDYSKQRKRKRDSYE